MILYTLIYIRTVYRLLFNIAIFYVIYLVSDGESHCRWQYTVVSRLLMKSCNCKLFGVFQRPSCL